MAKLSQLNLPIKDESTGQITSQTFDIGGKEYTAGYGINIDANDEIASTTFVGTQAEWDALTPAEQAAFDIINITDDYTPSTEIQISYVDSLPVSGIRDILYGLRSFGTPASATAADGFLDSVDAFTKTSLLPSGYEYTSGTAEISLDGITYVRFDSIVYDGTKFIIDGETDLALGDTLYYRVLSGITYYGGDAKAQSMTALDKAPVDVVADGNMNAVTSNAVADEVADVLRADTMEEIGGTASKAYKLGEYFFGTDGLMYEVTAAIASGGTITLNTNCVKTDIGEELYHKLSVSPGTELTNVDLDTILTAGVYLVKNDCSNYPSAFDGKMIVLQIYNTKNYFIQYVFTRIGTMFIRKFDNFLSPKWSNWNSVLAGNGGSFTENLNAVNSNIDVSQSDNGVLTELTGPGIIEKDANNKGYAGFRGRVFPNGKVSAEIFAQNFDSNGTAHAAMLRIKVDKDGSVSYDIPSPNVFLAALGGLSTAGGTVTGRITQRDTVTDVTQANNGLSSNTWYYLIGKGDKNNKGFAEIQSRIYTNGDVGLALQPQNLDSSGNIKTGSFNVIVDKSGVTKYEVTYGKNLRAELGFGYGTCNTAQATAAKEATIENYNLVSGSYVTIKFTNAVPANATLNINNKGAKAIYYLGVAIEDQVIGASDVATFIYDGSYYQLISVNKSSIPTHDAMPSNYVSFPGLSINSNFTVAGTCSSQNLMSLSFRGRISSQTSMASYTPLITFDHVTLKRLPLFEVWVSYNDTTPIDCYLANESNKLTLYSRAAKTLDANAMFTFSATIPVYRW